MGRFLSDLTFKYLLRLELGRHSSLKFLDTYTHVCVHDIQITHKILSETGIVLIVMNVIKIWLSV